ncbi:hypothetical protein F8M41_021728 [Gigaspora margarita]|uniref:Uncharacterized protein n=1 Tax=Gigaspora margarita TaxID=4874 RepID=A0A8H4EIT9_GIGMA|nr:hypothetical protein F8M41_021728 [Gigaspora margarita]
MPLDCNKTIANDNSDYYYNSDIDFETTYTDWKQYGPSEISRTSSDFSSTLKLLVKLNCNGAPVFTNHQSPTSIGETGETGNTGETGDTGETVETSETGETSELVILVILLYVSENRSIT